MWFFNFNEHSIKPEILDSGICTSSKTIIKIAFNLFNNYPTDTLLNCFDGLDDYNFRLVMNAILLRLSRKEYLKIDNYGPINKI
jgi:hypothetical protein